MVLDSQPLEALQIASGQSRCWLGPVPKGPITIPLVCLTYIYATLTAGTQMYISHTCTRLVPHLLAYTTQPCRECGAMGVGLWDLSPPAAPTLCTGHTVFSDSAEACLGLSSCHFIPATWAWPPKFQLDATSRKAPGNCTSAKSTIIVR